MCAVWDNFGGEVSKTTTHPDEFSEGQPHRAGEHFGLPRLLPLWSMV